jgi:hypothetical protein
LHELGSIDVMRLDQTLGQSRHVACASSCISMRTSLEEGIKLHTFAGIFPEQFFTEAGRHREAVVAADQRKVIRCFRDDLAGFVHDVSHVPPPIQRAGLVDAPFWRHHEGRDRQLDAVILSDRSREIIRLFEERERKRHQVLDSLAATPFRQTASKPKLMLIAKRRPF